MIPTVSLVAVATAIFFLVRRQKRNKNKWQVPAEPISSHWKVILTLEVPFYRALSDEEQRWFEFEVQEFLLNCKITGIETKVDAIDRVLVASSAVIPIFAFREWKYPNIHEVLLYPSMFNERFETEGPGRKILGMVGSGFMEGTMILSKPALRHGFKNESDKKNTAIHEFVHLIDKADGAIDGVPSILLERQYTLPWIDLINKKIAEIFEGESDVNPYGGTNKAEFFAVISEYFFERPKLLEKKHPELYALLERIFRLDMADKNLNKRKVTLGRNSPCPCDSGRKFKKCCGSERVRLA